MKFNSRKELLNKTLDAACSDPKYNVSQICYAVIPFQETPKAAFKRCAAYIERIQHTADITKAYTVFLAYDGKHYFYRYDNPFLAGTLNAAQRDAALKVADNPDEEALMQKLYGTFKDAEYGENTKPTDTLSAGITRSVITKIESLFHDNSTLKHIPRHRLETFLEKRLFKKHIRLEGPKGSGKMHLARHFAEANADLIVTIAGSEKTDSAKLQGHIVPYIKKISQKGGDNLFESQDTSIQTFVFQYGRLARAFRAARAGIKTIVLIDKGHHMPPDQMHMIVTALTPCEGYYILCVSNMVQSQYEWENHPVEEEIRAPVKNLMVIMSTNEGAGYPIKDIDEALQECFHTLLVPEERDVIEAVIQAALSSRNFSPHFKNNLMAFYDKMKHLQKNRRIVRDITMRHFIEVIETSKDENDLGTTLFECYTKWASPDAHGSYTPKEIQEIEKIIAAVF